jgi:tellurite resistance protein TerC
VPHAPLLLAGFAGLVLAMLALDLGVVHRRGTERSLRATALVSLAWIALALGFTVAIHFTAGHVRMLEFVTGYLIEYSLSVDNLFVFLTIFTYFQVPKIHQHRVLLWGILGAVFLRLLFILAGAALLRRFHWFEEARERAEAQSTDVRLRGLDHGFLLS